MTERYGLGPNGYCICPKCNYKAKHQRGTPCQEMKCPNCGTKMMREGSYHHDLFRKKNNEAN